LSVSVRSILDFGTALVLRTISSGANKLTSGSVVAVGPTS